MKRKRYLNRVALCIVCLVLVPLICLSLVIWHNAAKELKKNSRIYYEQVVSSFAADFEERMSALQEHAISIILDSKKDKSIFHQGLERAQDHPYWYYQAVLEMQDLYHHYDAVNCGVYYYDLDRSVTVGGTTSAQFFLFVTGIRDPEHSAWEFFDEANYRPDSWIFRSTITDLEKNAHLLAGYCSELGKNKDRVIIFYSLSRDDYAGLQSVVFQKSGINFYIRDASGENTLMFIGDSEMTEGEVYRVKSRKLPLTYEIQVSENYLKNNLHMFDREARVSLWVLGSILVLTCCASIFIVYRPVSDITAELGTPESVMDEFGNIRYVLNERNSVILEQKNLILELLLKHLIHGVPLSPEDMGRLGIARNMNRYCVLMVSGYVPSASEAEQLAEQAEKRFAAQLFCTDWQARAKSIFILFFPGEDVAPIVREMDRSLRTWGGDAVTLIQGTVADKLDGIRDSFLSCLAQHDAREESSGSIGEDIGTLEDRDTQQKLLEKKILDYLERHFRDPELSQLKVADTFRVSIYTLSRLFKNRVGIGFAEYVNTRRLEYARDLLLTTSLSVKEIAVQSGYTSESYFGRIFKATYGLSPTAFRNQ